MRAEQCTYYITAYFCCDFSCHSCDNADFSEDLTRDYRSTDVDAEYERRQLNVSPDSYR